MLARIGALGSLLFAVVYARPGASQTPSPTLESFLAQASELENSGNYRAAEKTYRQALAQFPNQPEVLKRLGIVYQTELKFPESIDTFQRALQVNPQYPEVNFYIGMSYFGLNQYEKSLEHVNTELKLHPDYRRAHYYAAKVLLALGRKGEAIEHFETLAKRDPNETKVWFELAKLHRSLAVEAYNRIATLDPDSV